MLPGGGSARRRRGVGTPRRPAIAVRRRRPRSAGGSRASRRRRGPCRQRRCHGQAHVHGDAAGDRRGVSVPRRGHRRAVRRRVHRDPARGARSRERRHGAPLGRCRRRRRRGVHRQLGRSVQPEDRALVGRVDLPPADRPGRGDRRRRSGPRAIAGCRSSRWTGTAIKTSTRWTSASPPRSCSATRRTDCPRTILAMADARVRVPHRGKAESLNLAAAATVCLFEWARRRHSGAVALETIVAAAAHDIRSPLTAMKGFGYALEKRWGSMTEEQRTLMLQGIVYDADRMDAILRLLVDAGRVASGSLELFPERVDLSELALGIIESVRRDPEHPEVRWAGEADVVVTDPARAKSAILSFIESQVWWGREGPITIEGRRVGRPAAPHRLARRDGAHARGRGEAVRGPSSRHRGREQDRPVRRPRRRGDAGRARVGGRDGRAALVPPRDPAPPRGLSRAAC